jgi:hypothetical protein
MPFCHPGQDVMVEADFRRGVNPQGNAFGIERGLECLRRRSDARGPILVAPGMHVRRNHGDAYACGHGVARELQRGVQVFGTVVDPGKQMAVEVDHALWDEYPP